MHCSPLLGATTDRELLRPVHAPANCDENVGPQAPSYAGRGTPSAALQASLIRSETARLLRSLRSEA